MPFARDLRCRARAGRVPLTPILATLLSAAAVATLLTARAPAAEAATTIAWKGHTWQVTSGGMAGVCRGDPNNVSVDGDGYLHLKITSAGGAWTAAEMFTTDKLGFGTYQWQVDGPIDTYDKNVVLGFFPYGPAAGIGADGTNEIDIEYSRWGQQNGPNGDWTDYPASGNTVGELSYSFSLDGATLSTSRFAWSRTGITSSLFGGLTPVDSTAGYIKSWSYAPTNPTVNIPQQALPLGVNLWCFDSSPSDGKPVEIVVRDFQFVPEGSSPGSGGSGPGGSAGGGIGGSSGVTLGTGGRPGTGGLEGTAGTMGATAGSSGGATAGTGGGSGGRPGAGGADTGGSRLGSGGPTSTGGAPAGSGGASGNGSGASGATSGSGAASAGCGCAMTDADASTGRWALAIWLAGAVVAYRRRPARRRAARHS